MANTIEILGMVESLEKQIQLLKRLIEAECDIKKQPVAIYLKTRASRCLASAGIKTIGELTEKTPEELLSIRNLGLTTLDEIQKALEKLGGLKLRAS